MHKEKILEKKRNHHYIFREYLKAWETDNKIWYTTKDKIAHDSTKGLSRETDFYRFSPLTEEDILFIKLWISRQNKTPQGINNNLLEELIHASELIRKFERVGATDHAEALRCNTVEEIHGIIERKALPLIKLLREGGTINPTATKEKTILYKYISYQMLRTKEPKELVIAESARRSPSPSNIADKANRLLSRNWNIIAATCANNIAVNLVAGGFNCQTIENDSSTPFITSDRPVNNIHPSSDDSTIMHPPSGAVFYYPLSPRFSIIISKEPNKTGVVKAQDNEVSLLNKHVAKFSFGRLYSNSKESLHELLKIRKSWLEPQLPKKS